MSKEFLDFCEKSFDNLVYVKGNHWKLSIGTNMFFDGDNMTFNLEEIAPKTLKIYTDRTFWEWLAYATTDIGFYHHEIKTVASRFGVDWNEETLELSVTFKRNQMSIGQAFFRLMQTVGIVGNFRYYVWFEGKP